MTSTKQTELIHLKISPKLKNLISQYASEHGLDSFHLAAKRLIVRGIALEKFEKEFRFEDYFNSNFFEEEG